MSKKDFSERDICTKCITPALQAAGWDIATQIREEFPLTKGRIIVRGKLHTRAQHKRADYVLFYKPNMPIAVIEAKDANHSMGDGMQQGLGYAEMLQALADPGHPEREGYLECLGDDFDPKALDIEDLNAGLAMLKT